MRQDDFNSTELQDKFKPNDDRRKIENTSDEEERKQSPVPISSKYSPPKHRRKKGERSFERSGEATSSPE